MIYGSKIFNRFLMDVDELVSWIRTYVYDPTVRPGR